MSAYIITYTIGLVQRRPLRIGSLGGLRHCHRLPGGWPCCTHVQRHCRRRRCAADLRRGRPRWRMEHRAGGHSAGGGGGVRGGGRAGGTSGLLCDSVGKSHARHSLPPLSMSLSLSISLPFFFGCCLACASSLSLFSTAIRLFSPSPSLSPIPSLPFLPYFSLSIFLSLSRSLSDFSVSMSAVLTLLVWCRWRLLRRFKCS